MSHHFFEDDTTPSFRLFRTSVLAAGVGVVAGIAAFLLLRLIAILSNLFFYGHFSPNLPSISDNPWGLWLPLLPAAGGLAIGLLARVAPAIAGHGIPEAMEAVLFRGSRISPRIALLKPLSTALAIGTGGPFGAEGPIIQTGGALGSMLGQLLDSTPSERKVLLACGAAAGMAATFSTPISAVILAIELLLFEFKSRSFIPLVMASTLATNVHFLLFGWGPLFRVDPVNFGLPGQLPYYAGLGVLAGGAAILLTRSLYFVEDLFERLPLDPIWRPALGGALLGLIGLFVPRVLGVGYDTITAILNSHLDLTMLLAIMVFKYLALLVSLGSGTSGGLLAPTFMSSAAMGGLYALAINSIYPSANLAPGAYALAALAAVFGAASRSTFAFIVFAFEITRNYEAVLPIMIVAVIADGIGLLFLPNSIMTEKLARRGQRVHQEFEADPLQQVLVEEVMRREMVMLDPAETIGRAAERHAFHEQRVVPLVESDGRLVGVVTRGDILKSLADDPTGSRTVLQAGSKNLRVAFPKEPVAVAVRRLLRSQLGHLPVVDPERPDRLLGILSRESVLRAYEKRHHEESQREPGWLSETKPRSHRVDPREHREKR